MSLPNNVTGLTVSFDSYIRNGWKLIPIPPNTKGPRNIGWNKQENCLTDSSHIPTGYGVGLAHAYSGTMALDIDNWDEAKELLAAHNIDLTALYDARDAVTIDSGRQGRGKLLYAMPFGLTLTSKKITNDSGDVVYELRCAAINGTTVQDILPPSVHPETNKPYQWGGKGNWQQLPALPIEIITLWQALIEGDTKRNISNGTIDASWNEITSALSSINPECGRDDWVAIGMALQYAGKNTDQEAHAFSLWDDWSSTAPTKYKGKQDLIGQWKSFRVLDNGIKLGTLFHIAGQHGWKRPAPDVSELFKRPARSHLDIINELRQHAPDIDLSVFPPVLRQRAEEVAMSAGCDPIVPLFAGLGAVCAAVDARSRLELMDGFKVAPILWIMTIGNPAEKKSPGASPMLDILYHIEKEDRPRQALDMLRWEALDTMYQSSKTAYLKQAGSAEQVLHGDDLSNLPPVAAQPPAPPVGMRLVVQDITSQKLVRIVADRQRGVLCHLDEMSSWCDKVTDRKSAEDRSAWTRSIEGGNYTMDRVGLDNSIFVDNFAVSIFGNIQPQVYKKAVNAMATDGLLQRFIPGILREGKTGINNPIPHELTNIPEWENTIRQVYAAPTATYKLSHEAYDEYREFQGWYHDNRKTERLLESDNTFMQAYGKMEGLVGRIALILHIIENPSETIVQHQTMVNAIWFVRGYVIPALRYSLSEIASSVDETLDGWMMRHIIQLSGETLTLTLGDLRRSARRQIEHMHHIAATEALKQSMDVLERAGWVATTYDTGRRTEWAINPDISNSQANYRHEVIKAKQKQSDERVTIARRAGAKVERKIVVGYDPDTMDE